MNEEQHKIIIEKLAQLKEHMNTSEKPDRSTGEYLEEMSLLIAVFEKCTKNDTHYVSEHTDYRSQGNDHSEVYYTVEMICCEECTREWHKWLTKENRGFMRRDGIYYSQGAIKHTPEITKIGQKITVHAGRSMASSLDSDEMRRNSEWLD
jgi:hypothetical protein